MVIHAEPDGGLSLTARDTGAGFPPGFDIARQQSLGFQLVVSLTKQIKGTLALRNDGGASFRLAFKDLPNADR
jgi:two-component sensor histidine kinase